MKKYLLLLLLASFSIEAQIVTIPDANFKAKLLEADYNNNIAQNQVFQNIKIDINNDGEIQESEANLVYNLDIRNSSISNLEGITNFSNVKTFYCSNNQILNLNLAGMTNLNNLIARDNQIQSLNLDSCPNLIFIELDNNFLTYFELSDVSELYGLYLKNNLLNNIILQNVNTSPSTYTIDLTNNPLQTVNVINSNLNSVTSLNSPTAEIIFTNSEIKRLNLQNTQLQSLDLSNNSELQNLYIDYNENPDFELNIVNSPSLQYLRCSNSGLTFLDLTGCANLFDVEISGNQLTEIVGLSDCLELRILSCSGNNLEFLNLSGLENLDALYCSYNSLVELNIEECSSIIELECIDNQIEYLNLKNGNDQPIFVDFYNNPIVYVCSNENQVNLIRTYMDDLNISGHVNSYCSFNPGGEFFTIQGNSKLDLSSNGCDENDIDIPNMKFNITNGIISGSIISNNSGDYSIPVQEGTHTLTPVLESPTYFNVSPSNFAVTFPTETSPFTQNFCITPNGIHQDVEVVIVPLNTAIPGFDTSYKLVYKNKGNTVVSGSLSMTFIDNVMDFVSSTPVQSMVEPNILNWNYTDLQPFETRVIEVVFNLNSPQESPALNDGEILEFIAIVDPLSGDEMPSDNTSTLNQTVVNSYDPNDKTCLEGSVVSTELIGQYVHYVIRFENTGTFFAQNVVVKDEIDLAKFDISTLIPQHSSHDYFARINGNIVEFIFENIQLPFPPSEERHGYIAFKIKLKNNLTVGDTFSNFASIYFDYNFPIITESATTTIEALSTSDFEFSSFVKLYPNPANSIVTIESQSSINLKSVEIFNSLGQLLQAIPNDNNQLNIDVSQLQIGTYFVKVHSDKGVGVSKFVKQ